MSRTLFIRVFIGMIAGIVVGLFLGSYVLVLKPFSDAMGLLFQMAVVPYIATSLMHGLGSLPPQIAKKMIKSGWSFLLLLWIMVFASIYLMADLIPPAIQGGIGQSLHTVQDFISRFLTYILPENPFYALANNVVCAVAVLGVVVGCAIMHLPQKEPLLGFLEKINNTIEKIFYGILYIAPVAAFLRFAVDTGTFNHADFTEFLFFISGFIVLGLFLALFVMPLLLTHLTPMSYREVLKEFGFVSFFGFAVGHSSITLPMINQSVKRLSLKYGLSVKYGLAEDSMRNTDHMAVPLGFSFAQIGNLLMLFYVLYASFYFRIPFSWKEQILLPFMMISMSLGPSGLAQQGLSFLLDQLHFTSAASDLFLNIQIFTEHFQILLSSVGVFTFVMLVLFSYYQKLQINLKGLLVKLGAAFGVFIVAVVLVKHQIVLTDHYSNIYYRLSMRKVMTQFPEFVHGTPKLELAQRGNLAEILKSGVLRVGFNVTNIPFCYLNNSGEYSGFDMAFAFQLAKDLECKLELVHLDIYKLAEQFDAGDFDIVMAGLVMTEERLTRLDFTQPYYTAAKVLVVRAKDKSNFLNLEAVKAWEGVRIGGIGAYGLAAKRLFPLAQVTTLITEQSKVFSENIDAVLWDEAGARAWCMDHSEYVYIDYDGGLGHFFLAYSVPKGAFEWLSFLNSWLDLKKESKFTDIQENYWINGIPPPSNVPQWSIIRNVLQWVD